jgi:subtilisin family serine protease
VNNDGTTTPGTENYVYYQGNSMSALHVTGVAALLYQADPNITPAQAGAWDFGDGNTSTAQDPVNLYAAAGSYTSY